MATEGKTKKKSKCRTICMWLLGVIGFLAIVFIWWYVGQWPMSLVTKESPTLADYGAFGDMFGFVNSLFSALALFAIVITLWMQREELRMQRELQMQAQEEWKKTVEAQTRSAKAQEEAAKIQEKATEVQQWQVATTKFAIYMQGVIALQQSPPVEQLTIQQAAFLERIASMVSNIEEHDEEIADCVSTPEVLSLVIHRLLNIKRTYMRRWEDEAKNSGDVRATGALVARDARVEMEKIIDDNPSGY